MESGWVTKDVELCNDCGLCSTVCLPCLSFGGHLVEEYAVEPYCSACGHCIAVCPQGALKPRLQGFEEYGEIGGRGIDPTDFVELLRRRRSHRTYKDHEVDRKDLEYLLNTCRYAPTGSNVQNVEVVVVRNRFRIRKLSDLTLAHVRTTIDETVRRTKALQSKGQEIPGDLHYAMKVVPKRERLFAAKERGMDPIFYGAPVVLVFHSTPYTSTPKDNCLLAAHTFALTAPTLGLETCYIGIFERAANEFSPLVEELALPAGNRVYAVLIIGYPEHNYLRGVYRKPLTVRWE